MKHEMKAKKLTLLAGALTIGLTSFQVAHSDNFGTYDCANSEMPCGGTGNPSGKGGNSGGPGNGDNHDPKPKPAPQANIPQASDQFKIQKPTPSVSNDFTAGLNPIDPTPLPPQSTTHFKNANAKEPGVDKIAVANKHLDPLPRPGIPKGLKNKDKELDLDELASISVDDSVALQHADVSKNSAELSLSYYNKPVTSTHHVTINHLKNPASVSAPVTAPVTNALTVTEPVTTRVTPSVSNAHIPQAYYNPRQVSAPITRLDASGAPITRR